MDEVLKKRRWIIRRRLEGKKVDLVRSLESGFPKVEGLSEGKFGVITGAENAISRSRQMMEEAKREYVIVMSRYSLKRAKKKRNNGCTSFSQTTGLEGPYDFRDRRLKHRNRK